MLAVLAGAQLPSLAAAPTVAQQVFIGSSMTCVCVCPRLRVEGFKCWVAGDGCGRQQGCQKRTCQETCRFVALCPPPPSTTPLPLATSVDHQGAGTRAATQRVPGPQDSHPPQRVLCVMRPLSPKLQPGATRQWQIRPPPPCPEDLLRHLGRTHISMSGASSVCLPRMASTVVPGIAQP